ncbi:methylamine dehydrogenase light chain [Gilvimarinus sp. F26214L]|uniref:methylamine dehydrogenase light chain n=1 Tax=Gilvimarinus sp. DZF01 TaxID=3461371 RepID=UPI004045B6DF
MSTSRQDLIEQLLRDLDASTTGALRFLAARTSRRSFLGRFGSVLAGVAAFPLLPVARDAAAQSNTGPDLDPVDGVDDLLEMGDPQSCEYWRYCGFSGQMCSCCGGSLTRCPPGSQTATVAWIGTCHNPTDGRDYLISYNDCCGKSSCGDCRCSRHEGDRPVYFPSKSNSILWCFGTQSHAYHCTLALVIGHAGDSAR